MKAKIAFGIVLVGLVCGSFSCSQSDEARLESLKKDRDYYAQKMAEAAKANNVERGADWARRYREAEEEIKALREKSNK
jgi:hypothetical protein